LPKKTISLDLKKGRGKIIQQALDRIVELAVYDLRKWAKAEIPSILVNGDGSVKGITQTPFFEYIKSQKGRSELGINMEDVNNLVSAYLENTKVVISRNKELSIEFGNVAKLKMATPHPRAGVKHLQIQSWLEWAVDGVDVDSVFVPASKLGPFERKFIKVKDSPGGLMVLPGSRISNRTGLYTPWKFPEFLKNYDKHWISENSKNIEKLVFNKLRYFIKQRSK
jgi:hypothetical protein